MRLDQKIRLLAELPVFAYFEPEALRVMAFSAEETSVRAGAELFKKGEASKGGYVVLQGRIALNAYGSASLAGADSFGPGTLIGESALFAETTRPATAIAVEPTLVLDLTRVLMHRVLEAHPDSAAALRRHIAATVASTEFGLKDMLG